MTLKNVERTFAAVLAAAGWAAVATQTYWAVELSTAKGLSLAGGLINTLSYFTILTNILVALVLSAIAAGTRTESSSRFLSPASKTALASYILIVGCVYEVALRRLWNPEGLHLIVDVILHYIVPIGYFTYWLLFVPKGSLRYGRIWSWTIYPLAYLVYSAVRGWIYDFFPYPFINFREIGWGNFAVNGLLLCFVFVATGLLLIGLDRSIARFKIPLAEH